MGIIKKFFGSTDKKEKFSEHLPQKSKEFVDNCCPYCGSELTKIPTRKTKCPSCVEEIYVRSTQKLFPSTLLTKDQAIAVDAFKELEFSFNVSLNDYLAKKEELLGKFGKDPNPRDVIWGLFNQ